MPNYTETKTRLIINKLSREKYDYLVSNNLISENELYLVKDTNLDAVSARLLNVGDPISASDGTNKQYVDDIIENLSGVIAIVRDIDDDSAIQIQTSAIPVVSGSENIAISHNSIAVGASNVAGLKGYRYTNTGTVTNSLTFEVAPEGWAIGDVVSIINNHKYSDCSTIASISGNTVTFTTNFPFDTIVEESDWDSKVAYVSTKPNLGNVDLGYGAQAEGVGSKALNVAAHAEGRQTQALGQYSHAEGRGTTAQYSAHAEGRNTTASGDESHSEGDGSIASGQRSHAEGSSSEASGYSSHAEGGGTVASGRFSHAEGYDTKALPIASDTVGHGTHAEGIQTQAGNGAVVTNFSSGFNGVAAHAEGGGSAASGRVSHAEGLRTLASGIAAHSEGIDTVAQNQSEHAQGQYNKSNKASGSYGNAGNTLHSVGYGTSESTRKNALEIMQNGKVFITGIGGYDGTNPTGSGVKDLANEVSDKAPIADTRLTLVYSDTPTFTEWTISPSGKFHSMWWSNDYGEYQWLFDSDDYPLETNNYDFNATSVSAVDPNDNLTYTATRARTDIKYILGPNTSTNPNYDKPLPPANVANDLYSHVSNSNIHLTANERTKLAGIAPGAQVNVLEGVKVGTTALTPTNKVVTIPLATSNAVGVVKPDNSTITVNASGVISANIPTVPIATSATPGIVKPDGTTITVDANGVISSSGGGGATGYTVTFANDFYEECDHSSDLIETPIRLIKADGTSEVIDLHNGVALRGTSVQNVVMIESGVWRLDNSDGYSFAGYGFDGTFSYDYSLFSTNYTLYSRGISMIVNGVTTLLPAIAESVAYGIAIYAPWNCGQSSPFTQLKLTGNATITYSWAGVPCLLKGTLIRLANGQDKPIEEITYDDELLVWDFDNGKLASAKPLWIKKPQIAPYYFKNILASGKELLTTGQSKTGWGHRMFDMDKGKFRYTTETVSDRIFTLGGTDLHKSCERIEARCEFYNIITEKHFNLFANGILTSCSYNNLYPVKDMKFVKDNRRARTFEAYDVPLEYYNGMRLSEQTIDPAEVNEYIGNLVDTAVERSAK